MTTSSPEFRAWLPSFVADAGTDGEADRFVAIVDQAILGEIPEIREDPILVKDLHRSTQAQFRSYVNGITQAEHRLVLPDQAVDLARSLARRGMDLGVLLKVYRAAHSGVFKYFTDVVDAIPEESGVSRQEALVLLWNRAEAWMNDSIEDLIKSFYSERALVLEGNLARRRERVDAILAGDAVPMDTASTDLGHPLNHWQVGYIVWSPENGPELAEAMANTALDVARALGAPRPLTLNVGTHDLWCWAATSKEPSVSELLALGDQISERGLRVTVGVPALGVDGFRTSHAEAKAAQRLALGGAVTPALLSYDEVELLCLALDNEPALRRMVVREIGDLCAADKNLALVRETALAFLTRRQNVEATANQLFVHKNTVRYRLARAEELIGHPLAERATQVELALRYVALFGPPSAES